MLQKEKRKGLDERVRGTLGGDRLPKTYDVTAYTSDMTTKKILLNHCVSNDHYFCNGILPLVYSTVPCNGILGSWITVWQLHI